MLRKITASVFLFSLVFVQPLLAEPLYWKAEKNDYDLLIFGSIHMGTPHMYPLPATVMDHLHHSQGLITEVGLSTISENKLGVIKETTGDILNPKQKKRLSDITSELSLPLQVLEKPPWQTALTLQLSYFMQLGLSPDYGIDLYLKDIAISRRIPVLGLETSDYQLDLFTRDKRTGRILLIDTLNNWEKNKTLSHCLVKSWKAGNQQQLQKLAEKSEIEPELTERIIYQRNRNWADKLSDPTFLTKPGKYTIAVGAIHLAGPRSLPALLQKKGFLITQLSNPEPVDCNL